MLNSFTANQSDFTDLNAKLSNSFWIDFITKTSSVLALQQPLTQLVLCSSNVSITGLLCGAEYTVVSIVVSWQDAIQSRKHKRRKTGSDITTARFCRAQKICTVNIFKIRFFSNLSLHTYIKYECFCKNLKWLVFLPLKSQSS